MAEREAEATLGGRRGRAECECTAAGGRVASRADRLHRARPRERGESAATERADRNGGRQQRAGRVHSLPLALRADPAGRPAGKPAEPRSAPRPAAPETRSQSRRCERPAFLGLFGRKTYLEKADTLTKSFTQSGRYLC